jgi:hypothetical protein
MVDNEDSGVFGVALPSEECPTPGSALPYLGAWVEMTGHTVCALASSAFSGKMDRRRSETGALPRLLSVVRHCTPAKRQFRHGCSSSQRVFFSRQWLHAYESRFRFRVGCAGESAMSGL